MIYFKIAEEKVFENFYFKNIIDEAVKANCSDLLVVKCSHI